MRLYSCIFPDIQSRIVNCTDMMNIDGSNKHDNLFIYNSCCQVFQRFMKIKILWKLNRGWIKLDIRLSGG